MSNEKQVNAPIEKIVEAINDGIIDGDIVFVDQYTHMRFFRILKDKLASLSVENQDSVNKSKEEFSKLLAEMPEHFKKDIEEVSQMEFEGPTLEEYLKNTPPHQSEREVLERFENIAGHMIPCPDGGWIRYAELFYKYPHLA